MAELSVGATQTPPETPAPPVAVADEAVAGAERIAFLALASELARGRKVLVIDDGASALAGIAAHLDSTPIEQIAGAEDGAYELVVADLSLTGDAERDGAAQLARVVDGAAGVALLRVPNRPEFAPLVETFAGSFARSLTMRQHNWVSSALFDDAMFANDDPARAVAASVRKMAAAAEGEELYQVIVAAQGAFPDFRPQLALTRSPELRRVLAELEDERARAETERAEAAAREVAQDARIRQLEEELAWYDENQLAVREKVEQSGAARALLGIWVTFASNLERIRRVLRG